MLTFLAGSESDNVGQEVVFWHGVHADEAGVERETHGARGLDVGGTAEKPVARVSSADPPVGAPCSTKRQRCG